MNDNPIPREALLPLPEVTRLTSLTRSSIYAGISAGTFPAPRQVGLRKVAWRASEVLDWIDARPGWAPTGKPAASPSLEAGPARHMSPPRNRPRRTTPA